MPAKKLTTIAVGPIIRGHSPLLALYESFFK